MLVLDSKSSEDIECHYVSLYAESHPSQHPTPLIKMFDGACLCV